MTSRVAVLASGTGSNLQAILDHGDRLGPTRAAHVAVVVSNQQAAGALDRARARGLPAEVLSDPAHGTELMALLDRHAVDMVVLAGYLKLVPAAVVRRFEGRMLNVHPALLPSFGGAGMYGRRVHEAVLRAGARVSGVTVHFVSDEYDRGAIVSQWPVPVLAGDTPESLAARVLRAEHLLYPRVVEALAAGRLQATSAAVLPDDLAASDAAFALADHAAAAAAMSRLVPA